MSHSHVIDPIKNSNDKRETYAYLLGRYKKALRDQFFFEALMITYAMQEDRLRSMLYYIGALQTRTSTKVTGRAKDDLKRMLQERYGDNARFNISSISGKMQLINMVLTWAEKANENDNEYSDYLKCLKCLMESVDIDGLACTLNQIEGWLAFRNEVIHASMNKNLGALYEGIDERIGAGMQYARDLDTFVKVMKKDNCVRRKLKMGNE